MIGCLLAASVTGCGTEDRMEDVSESLADAGESGSGTEGFAAEDGREAPSAEGLGVSEMFTERDLSGEYDAAEAEEIVLSERNVTITEEGVYLLSGVLTDGMVIVDADKNAKVQLVFDGVEMDNDADAAVYVKQADKVFVTLAEGSENSLTCRGYTPVDGDNIDGVIYAKSDLVINGTGSLTVNAAEGHGIVSRDDLKVTGGTLTVTAQKQGLSGKDSVRIGGGAIQITSGKDGIHAENNEDADKGFVYIGDGTIQIVSEGDGISAQSVFQADGGTVSILAGGGSGNQTVAVDENGDAVSAKGIKASAELVINRAALSIDSQDDAIHSNLNVIIKDGELSLATGDDGIHADETASVAGGNIVISGSYEGIEGKHVEISGGTIRLYATDDGVNAAGGNDRSGFGGMFGGGERFGNVGTGGPGSGNAGTGGPGSGNAGTGGPGNGNAGNGGPGNGNAGTGGPGNGSAGTGSSGNGSAGNGSPGNGSAGTGGPGNGNAGNGSPGNGSAGNGSAENGSAGTGSVENGNAGNAEGENAASYIQISGGVIYVHAGGDGLDSNGDLSVSGGELYVSGPENGANGALDYEGNGQITGGIVVAAGNSGMAVNFGETSTQGSLLVTTAGHSSGTVIALQDSRGKELVSYTAECSFNSIVISCPELELGGTYVVTAGDERMEITLSDSLIYGSGFGTGGFGNGGRMHGGGMPEVEMLDGERPRAPEVEMPEGERPQAPEVGMPDGERPQVSEVEMPEGERPRAPEVEMPEGERPQAPEVEMPEGERPQAPEVEVPDGERPRVSERGMPEGEGFRLSEE